MAQLTVLLMRFHLPNLLPAQIEQLLQTLGIVLGSLLLLKKTVGSLRTTLTKYSWVKGVVTLIWGQKKPLLLPKKAVRKSP